MILYLFKSDLNNHKHLFKPQNGNYMPRPPGKPVPNPTETEFWSHILCVFMGWVGGGGWAYK